MIYFIYTSVLLNVLTIVTCGDLGYGDGGGDYSSGVGGDIDGGAEGGYEGGGSSAGVDISQTVEITRHVPIPIYKHEEVPIPHSVPVPVPHPVAVPIPQPYPVHIKVPYPVAIPVIKTIHIPIEKPIPVPIEKPVPYHIEKPIPVPVEVHVPVKIPRPVPVKVPVDECDFLEAKLNLVPSSFKQSGQIMRNLSHIIEPLLNRQQNRILKYVQLLWPHFLQEGYKYTVGEKRYAGRILLVGSNMQGLNTHLVPSTLKHLEHLPSFVYDTRLFDRTKLASFINVQFNFPAVILLSRIDEWWNYIDDCDQHSIVSTLEDIHAGLPILTIASCKTDVPSRLHNFFYNNSTILVRIEDPNEKERETFLAPLFFDETSLSVYTVMANGRKYNFTGRKIIKCILDNNGRQKKDVVKESGKCRSSYTVGNVTQLASTASGFKGKRKREQSCHALKKKIKFCESKFGVVRSNSAGSLYDIHKQIKNEKSSRRGRRYESLTSFQSLKNKQYFTRVLSDLLNQRNTDIYRGASTTRPIETIMCDRLIKAEPNTESVPLPGTSSTYKRNVDGTYMKMIYNLWKHAAMVTSQNMTVAQLELLYDVISACINIHKNSFENLIENLETVLTQIERSYQVTENQQQPE
ncbi:hypothetical protein NQ315_009297 [Exocentrus adspersus]|uniref:Uncharacterized protein n=1 Tax=Exocentrus adspersus TaxID=1586481 RepID=A0AAV8WFX0_9CUCU|nr:hypothetical protein NQ315_009297 [Exocentrus adspersus]